ncbi:MAG TPA: hypothetical protein VIU86_04755 [Gaiellaceae bacterium]
MDAGHVAGLLVLIGVVGVLAAIVGSGLEAGPVKFPSIPGSRQKPLGLASVGVLAGGAIWWALLPSGAAPSTAGPARAEAPGGGTALRVVLFPVQAGARLVVEPQVYDQDGELGGGQCVLHWRDEMAGRIVATDTTTCNARFTEASPRPGVHRITLTAEGTADVHGTASRSLDVTVRA